MSYEEALAAEQKIYANCLDVHSLPAVFHYWSNRHLLPKLQALGFSGIDNFFAQHLNEISHSIVGPKRFVSLGSGNCDLEIVLASYLHARGYDFIFDCVDLNPAMLERGGAAARSAGVAEHLHFIQGDLNHWHPAHDYDAAIANQSLHHVVNLEALFEAVRRSLRPGAEFLVSDMIGRNGHQRWPEALTIVHEFWRRLPPSYRFNQLVGYYEELYQSWDCSLEGFEGVRSEDILALLLDNFHFRLCLTYGNVIDPFIDRAFGNHFDPACSWDRSFIDEVHRRDEEELAAGCIKPTHMIAILSNERRPSPEVSRFVRVPDKIVRPSQAQPPAYAWGAWPHSAQSELEIACGRLADTGRQIKQSNAWALNLQNQFEERTAWALSLEKDVEERTAWALRLQAETQQRTAWALSLDAEVEKRTAWALDLRKQVDALELEVEQRTLWALRLKDELAGQISRAERLDRELYKLIHDPLHLARRLFGGIRNRFFS